MRRTAETHELSQQISDIRIRLKMAGLAILRLNEGNEDCRAIANMVFEITDALEKATEKMNPDEDDRG
jgi:hypothetical protein